MNYTTEMKVYDCLGAVMWTAMLILLFAYQCHYMQCVCLHLISESLGEYNACTLYVGETT